jgi:hypothetical protein
VESIRQELDQVQNFVSQSQQEQILVIFSALLHLVQNFDDFIPQLLQIPTLVTLDWSFAAQMLDTLVVSRICIKPSPD